MSQCLKNFWVISYKNTLCWINQSTSTTNPHQILQTRLKYGNNILVRTLFVKRKYPVYPEDQNPEEIRDVIYTKKSASIKRIYMWGMMEHGALGINRQLKDKKNPPRYLHRPNCLSFAEKQRVAHIACGYGFTAMSVYNKKNNQEVYATGINTDSQLGYQAQRKDAPLEILLAPSLVQLPLNSSSRVKAMAAGRSHLLVLVVEGKGARSKVFALGNNAYGQCGREIVANENYMGSKTVHCIRDIDGQGIKDIVCGQDHSLFISTSGSVYACGWSADGQTGQGNYETLWQPRQLKGDIEGENITKISCSADCNLAINDKGDLFGWGNSEYGQMLTKDTATQLHTPRHINLSEVGPIKDIAAGGSFCAVLNSQGEVWVWGFGLLGLGPEVSHLTKPTRIPPTLLGHLPLSPSGYCITSLSCGLFHLAAVSSHGDLFTWGRNKSGCLGLGHTKDQPFPLRVSIGAHVLKAVCGVDHMAALCKLHA